MSISPIIYCVPVLILGLVLVYVGYRFLSKKR